MEKIILLTALISAIVAASTWNGTGRVRARGREVLNTGMREHLSPLS